MKHSILVVDDDIYIRVFLEKHLNSLGYTVHSAENGVDALEKAQIYKPELVISDWNMPKMNGIEFCQRLREDKQLKYCYFILLTAKDTQEEKIQGLESGADDYITKPLNGIELNARLNVGIRINRLQKEIVKIQQQKTINDVALTLSHEINNPLNIIILHLQSLLKTLNLQQNKNLTETLKVCVQQAKRIAEVVRKLRELQEPHTTPYLKDSDLNLIDLS